MNVRTATLLSIAGVLAAGTAAVAVNTQVLSGSDGVEQVASPLTIPAVTQVYQIPTGAAPGVAATGATSAGATAVTAGGSATRSQALIDATKGAIDWPTPTSPVESLTLSASPSVRSGAPAPMLMSFQIGDAAVATVDVSNGVLKVVDIRTSAGWRLVSTDDDGSVRLEIELESDTMKVEFEAFLSGGEVLTSISSEEIATPGEGTVSDDDDYDDDSYEDDDDDDEDEDDDEDDDEDEGEDEEDDDEDEDRSDDDD